MFLSEISKAFEKRPILFQGLFLSVAVPCLFLAFSYTNFLVNRGSLETFYQATLSRLYIADDIRTAVLLAADSQYFSFRKREVSWISSGDLVVGINGRRVSTGAEMHSLLEDLPEPTAVSVEVQRPTGKNYFLRFETTVGELLARVHETPVTVYVWHVPKGGASFRAGIRAGDLIHQINGETFESRAEADRMVGSTLRGREITFGVLRKGDMFDVTFSMARFVVPISLIFYQVVGFLWLGAGLFLGLFRAQLPSGRILAFGFFLVGMALILHEVEGSFRLPIPVFLSPLSFFLGLGALAHASYHFPLENARLLRVPIWRWHVYFLALPATVFPVWLGTQGMAIGLLLILIPQFVIRLRYGRKRSRERAYMEAWLFHGLTFGAVSVFTWAFLSKNMGFAWDLAVRGVTALMVLGGYVITIAKFRLLGVEIKRGLQYSIAMISWWVLLVLCLLHFVNVLSGTEWNLLNINLTQADVEILARAESPEEQLRRHKLTLMVLSILIGGLLWRVGMWGRQFLRRKFHRDDLDFLAASTKVKQAFDASLGLQGIAEELSSSLQAQLLLKSVVVVFFKKEKEVAAFHASGLGEFKQLEEACQQRTKKVIEVLKPFQTGLSANMLGPQLREPAEMGLRYICPIHVKERLMGCIMSGEKLSEAAYTPHDFRFLIACAGQTGVAVENAMLYGKLRQQERLRHELAIARQIQMASLPQEEPNVAGLDISGASLPAMEVGGDYYAYFPDADKGLTVVVADVSGKGTSAALYMSKMQGIFAALMDSVSGPRELFLKANPVLYREMERTSFITALGVRLDTQKSTLTCARAGHLPLIHFDASQGTCKRFTTKGLGLAIENRGLLNDVLEEAEISFQSGDVFLLMSDGLTEICDATGEMFGEEKVLTLLHANATGSARHIRDMILAEVNDFGTRDALQDDQTLVVIKSI